MDGEFCQKKKKKEKKRNLLSKNSSHLKLEMFDSGWSGTSSIREKK